MSKGSLTTLGTILFCIVAVSGIWFLISRHFGGSSETPPAGASDYAAVYLTNGSVYFGKLTWSLPEPRLTHVWVLEQGTTQKGQPQTNVVPFKNAVWSPSDEIYLNPQSVLYWTYLQSSSNLLKAMQSNS